MKLLYNTTASRFECQSTYAEKDLPKGAGFWWDPAGRIWHTSDADRAHKLREYATPDARERLAAVGQQIAASRATDADIPIPVPEGLAYMPFQRAGIAYAASRLATLNADEMGLGKTIQAAGWLNVLAKTDNAYPALFVCPASLKINTQREFNKWLVGSVSVGIATSADVPQTDVVIINYDILCKTLPELLSRDWATLVADEAHYAKNLSLQKDRRSGVVKWTGSARAKCLREIAEKVSRKLFLTGTPITDHPKGLYPILSMLDPAEWPARRFFGWAKRYCAAHHDGYGWDFSGASHLDELQAKLRSHLMVRRLKKDVLQELPPKTRVLVTLPSTKAQVAHEQEHADALDAVLSEDYSDSAHELRGTRVSVQFTKIAAARHQTALAKVDRVVQFTQETLEAEDKVIVFAHHKDVVAKLREGLASYNPVTIVGEDSMTARQKAVDAFQTDSTVQVVIGNIQAAGVGLTLTAARTVIFAELAWTPGDITQAEDRAHRIGQRDNVTVYHVVLDGSLDAKLARKLIDKQSVIDAALDTQVAAPKPKPETVHGYLQRTKKAASQAPPPNGVSVTEEQREAVHRAVQMLAGVCDGAARLDNRGFNKYDADFGRSLAEAGELTPKQAVAGAKMVTKYKRQLPEDLWEQVNAIRKGNSHG